MHCFYVILDAEYRNDLSEAILQMQESGKLSVLKIKWWKEKRGGGACQVSFHKEVFTFQKKKIIFSTDEITLEFMGSIIQVRQQCQAPRCDTCHNKSKLFLDCSILYLCI